MTPSTWPALAATATPLPRADLPIPLQCHQLPIPVPLLLENHNPKCPCRESHPLLWAPNQERGWTTVLQWQGSGGQGTERWSYRGPQQCNWEKSKLWSRLATGKMVCALKVKIIFFPLCLVFCWLREIVFSWPRFLAAPNTEECQKCLSESILDRNKHTLSPYGPSSMLHLLSTHQILKDRQLTLKA